MKKIICFLLVICCACALLTSVAYAVPNDLDYTYISLYTHNHSSTAYQEARRINEDRESTYWSLAEANYYNAFGLSPIQPATAKYNCHSYAWYNQSASNNVWVDSINTFATDATLISASDLQAGDIVVFIEAPGVPSHSAIIESISSDGNVTMLSKWGELGVYRHSVTNNPYYATTIGFLFFRIECKYNRSYTDVSNSYHVAICWCGATKYEHHTMQQSGNQLRCSKCGHTTDLWSTGPETE